MSDSVWPHRQQPIRLLLPWDFPGKSTGMGCHCLLQEMTWALYKTSSHHSFIYCVFHVSLLLNILGYITVIKSMREVQDYMDIATMKKSSNTWEIIFFQQMCILCLPNAKFYTLTEEGGVEERDTMVVLGDLIDWSTIKIWMLNNYL